MSPGLRTRDSVVSRGDLLRGACEGNSTSMTGSYSHAPVMVESGALHASPPPAALEGWG